jgi:hypothetical protein
MDGVGDSGTARLRLGQLHPYISLTIFQVPTDDPARVFRQILQRLKERSVKGRDGVRVVVSAGMDGSSFSEGGAGWLVAEPYQADAFVVRCQRTPPWASQDSNFTDTEHNLVIVFRRERLIAIHTDSASLRDAIHKWPDEDPRPPFRRVSEGVLHAAFLRGDSKGLWLRGTHARRPTKPDSKQLSGGRLQDALLPHEDSSFAMGSARAALPSDLGLAALSGSVGTTPRKSHMWGTATDSAAEFFAQANEALMLVEDVLAAGLSVEQPFPLLATREEDPLNVRGAFDISVLEPDDLQAGKASDELVEAATVLQNAIISITGDSATAAFGLDVGTDGSICGRLGGRVVAKGDKVSFRFGYRGEPTNGPPVRAILDALNDHADDLLTVYYESGHTVVERSIWKRELRVAPFPNWEFHDFTNFEITQEKPPVKGTQAIHDAIATGSDQSLFAWVVDHYAQGWLICDDGSGEIADFIHISPDQTATISLIHVKAAASGDQRRHVAVGPYEVVASQAAKNIRYLSPQILRDRITQCPIAQPAAWTDGRRVAGRTEFLEALACRSARDLARVVIVQPHVYRDLHQRVLAEDPSDAALHDVLRMSLLEALLNSARASVVGQGADLFVIGSNQ